MRRKGQGVLFLKLFFSKYNAASRFTLLNTCPGRLNLNDFISYVVKGLSDHHDIKMLAFLIVARLCRDFADSTALRLLLSMRVKRKSWLQLENENNGLFAFSFRAR